MLGVICTQLVEPAFEPLLEGPAVDEPGKRIVILLVAQAPVEIIDLGGIVARPQQQHLARATRHPGGSPLNRTILPLARHERDNPPAARIEAGTALKIAAAPPVAGLGLDAGVEPIAPEQVRTLVAEQLAQRVVDEGDGPGAVETEDQLRPGLGFDGTRLGTRVRIFGTFGTFGTFGDGAEFARPPGARRGPRLHVRR